MVAASERQAFCWKEVEATANENQAYFWRVAGADANEKQTSTERGMRWVTGKERKSPLVNATGKESLKELWWKELLRELWWKLLRSLTTVTEWLQSRTATFFWQ